MLRIVDGLVGLDRATRWLDHGCGLGGAVRYARAHGFDGVYGFDEGYAGNVMRQEGVPSIERRDFGHLAGSFDVVTSIDVLEHVVDPVAVLREIRGLLRPGGVLFLTTGNAEPFRRRLLDWSWRLSARRNAIFRAVRTVVLRPTAAGLLPTAACTSRGSRRCCATRSSRTSGSGTARGWKRRSLGLRSAGSPIGTVDSPRSRWPKHRAPMDRGRLSPGPERPRKPRTRFSAASGPGAGNRRDRETERDAHSEG